VRPNSQSWRPRSIWASLTIQITYKFRILNKAVFCRKTRGSGKLFNTFARIFSVFLGILAWQIIAFQCLAAIRPLQKKSYLKTYGRFFGFSNLCQNRGVNVAEKTAGRKMGAEKGPVFMLLTQSFCPAFWRRKTGQHPSQSQSKRVQPSRTRFTCGTHAGSSLGNLAGRRLRLGLGLGLRLRLGLRLGAVGQKSEMRP
jgi:hypothetical protein